jgi:hypothetical protein
MLGEDIHMMYFRVNQDPREKEIDIKYLKYTHID